VPPAASGAEKRAEALFNAAKQLRDSGQLAEACSMFAESKTASPGVGVTLYLGDCYERMGRTASAWTEYQDAENLARQRRDDKRAELAHARAQALEPKLGRLTIAASSGSHDGWQVQLDGNPLGPELWNAAIAVDPGDRVVTVSAPGKPARTLKAHLDEGKLVAKVSIDDTDSSGGGAAAAVATPGTSGAAEPTGTASSATETTSPSPSESSAGSKTRLWAELGLGGLGVVGLGLGAVFLVKKNQSMSNGTACDGPTVDQQASTASAISFAVGGVALASAVVLYLTTPNHASQVGGVTLSPTVMWSGGGAVLRSSF
jgi:hypothetical protein